VLALPQKGFALPPYSSIADLVLPPTPFPKQETYLIVNVSIISIK
jgi:hypothetical protein